MESSYRKGFSISVQEVSFFSQTITTGGGEAELGTPYSMRRIGNSEAQHCELWFMLQGTMRIATLGKILEGGPGMFFIHNSAYDRNCTMDTGVFSHFYFHLPGMNLQPGVFPSHYSRELRFTLHSIRRESLAINRSATLLELLVKLLDSYLRRELELTNSFPLIGKAAELIENEPQVRWSTSLLAQKLKLSPSSLYQKCMAQYGVSPKILIARIKFQHARFLLENTEMKLGEIAEHVGYGTEFAFSKAFLNYMGIRPGAVRRQKL